MGGIPLLLTDTEKKWFVSLPLAFGEWELGIIRCLFRFMPLQVNKACVSCVYIQGTELTCDVSVSAGRLPLLRKETEKI